MPKPQHTHTQGHREASLSLRVSADLLSLSLESEGLDTLGLAVVQTVFVSCVVGSMHHLLIPTRTDPRLSHRLCVKAEEDLQCICILSPDFPTGRFLDTATVPVSDFCFNFHLELNV